MENADLRQFGFWEALPASLSQPALYRDIAARWKGFGMPFLAGITLIFLIINALAFYIYFEKSKHAGFSVPHLIEIINQVPEINIEKGQASVAVPSSIRVPETNQLLIEINTSPDFNPKDAAGALIIVTNNKILLRESDETVEFPFSKIENNITLNQEILLKWARFLPFFLMLRDFLNIFLSSAIMALVLAAAAAILAPVLRISLEYRSLVRLAVVSGLPSMLLELFTIIANINLFKHESLIYFLLHAAYFYQAIEWVKQKPEDSIQKPEI